MRASIAYPCRYDTQTNELKPHLKRTWGIGQIIEPFALPSGHRRKEHSAYKKHGSCALLAAIEPLTGSRLGEGYRPRTQRDYALFCQALAAHYPEAQTSHLVQDNLNTHNSSSCDQHLPADQAFALAQRFGFHYPPKSASGLTMIESAMSGV